MGGALKGTDAKFSLNFLGSTGSEILGEIRTNLKGKLQKIAEIFLILGKFGRFMKEFEGKKG